MDLRKSDHEGRVSDEPCESPFHAGASAGGCAIATADRPRRGHGAVPNVSIRFFSETIGRLRDCKACSAGSRNCDVVSTAQFINAQPLENGLCDRFIRGRKGMRREFGSGNPDAGVIGSIEESWQSHEVNMQPHDAIRI